LGQNYDASQATPTFGKAAITWCFHATSSFDWIGHQASTAGCKPPTRADWLSCGFTPCSTQNRIFWRCRRSQSLGAKIIYPNQY